VSATSSAEEIAAAAAAAISAEPEPELGTVTPPPGTGPQAQPTTPGGNAGVGAAGGSAGTGPRPRARRKPAADKPPRRRGRPTTAESKAKASAAIERALAETLSLPAVPFSLVGDEFCAQHFATRGPQLAADLVRISENSPALRRVLERFVAGETTAVLVVGLAGYVLPPLLHHGLLPLPAAAASVFGVPVTPNTDAAARAAAAGEPPLFDLADPPEFDGARTAAPPHVHRP